MTIFNTILLILKKNKFSLALGLLISVGVSSLYSSSLNQSTEINLVKAQVVIFNEDSGAVSDGLEDYLKTATTVIKIENTQKAKDDALYFEQTDYILTIPENFGEDVQAGKTPKVDVQVRPDSYSKTLIDSAINHYLNTFTAYQKNMPDKNLQEQLTYTKENLAVKGTVSLDKDYAAQVHREATGGVFDLLSYGLFSSVFMGIACIYLAFNRPEIRKRNLCSPISQRELTRKVFFSSLVYSVLAFAVFILYTLIYTKSTWNGHTLLFLVNASAFFLTIITFSLMVASLAKNELIINAVSNTVILGSCFISGVFVPSEYLPDIVVKFSMLTPTYWFTHLNQLIAKATTFDTAFYHEVFFHLAILLCFCLVFLVINRIRQMESGGLKSRNKNLATD